MLVILVSSKMDNKRIDVHEIFNSIARERLLEKHVLRSETHYGISRTTI